MSLHKNWLVGYINDQFPSKRLKNSHQISISSSIFLLLRQGQPGRVHRNVTVCGDRARRTNGQNWGKIVILKGRTQPFGTKWGPNVQTWGKIAILQRKMQKQKMLQKGDIPKLDTTLSQKVIVERQKLK